MANLIPNLRQGYVDENGELLAGGKIYTYAAGTSTPLATYTDHTGDTENTNPIILDANGDADIWIGQSAYKFVITDADDVEIKTIDGVISVDNGSITTAKLADGSVTTIKIADGNVTTTKLADSSVTTPKIANLNVTTAKINNAAVTTEKLADESVTAAKLNDNIYSSVFSERNKIINGDMEFWQRGGPFVSPADKAFTADRWQYNKSGSMAYTISRENTIVPSFTDSGYVFNSSMKIACTTADAAIGSTDLTEVCQSIEGSFFKDLIKKQFVHTFWIYSNVTKTLCVAFKNRATGAGSPPTKSFVSEFTINAANTWQKITTVIPAPSDGSWNSNPSFVGLQATLVLSAGTTYQTTAGSWQNGNYSGTSTMDNFSDSNTNVMYVTGFRLEGGSIARQYESRHTAIEKLLCDRYCEELVGTFISYNPNVASVGSIGGMAPFSTPKANIGGSIYSSSTIYTERCNTETASFFYKGVIFSANFISGTAGRAELQMLALVEAEIS